MSEVCGVRSMWETLEAAAATFALFAAVNWAVGEGADSFCQSAAAAMLPLPALISSVMNARNVNTVTRILEQNIEAKKNMLHHGTIAIMRSCPMFIQFPASAHLSEELANLERREYKDKKELQSLYPLELGPAAAGNDASSHAHPAGELEGTGCAMLQFNPPAGRPAAAESESAPALNTNGAAATFNVDEESGVTQMKCLRIPDKTEERAALLLLGLAPTYTDLIILRSRNRFQCLVTGLQAGGYMLTVIQRVTQNLGISPVEAFVTFLCIIACMQLLVEFYACAHYQRPLLLRLNSDQLRMLSRFDPVHAADLQARACCSCKMAMLYMSTILVWLLLLGISMLYFLHFRLHHFTCALSGLLFFFAHVVPLGMLCFPDKLVILAYILLCPSSMILAVVSTIVYWKVFSRAANGKAWYAWILPHVSS